MFFKKMPLCAVGENSEKLPVPQAEKQILTAMTYNVQNCGDDPTGDFRAIDNIFIPKTLAFQNVIFGETSASDHRPLIAAVSL